jgi:hypothetical protein
METQAGGNEKHARPQGKKKEKSMLKAKSLIAELVKELDSSSSSGTASDKYGKEAFFTNLGWHL